MMEILRERERDCASVGIASPARNSIASSALLFCTTKKSTPGLRNSEISGSGRDDC